MGLGGLNAVLGIGTWIASVVSLLGEGGAAEAASGLARQRYAIRRGDLDVLISIERSPCRTSS